MTPADWIALAALVVSIVGGTGTVAWIVARGFARLGERLASIETHIEHCPCYVAMQGGNSFNGHAKEMRMRL